MRLYDRIFKTNGEQKYTAERVDEALAKWKSWGDGDAPAFRSIQSGIVSKETNTTFILKKKYFILNYNSFPNHYYLAIDDKVWHPGNLSTEKIFDTEISKCDNQLVSVSEKCYHCTYHYLQDMFYKDKKFNIFLNNCQNILGHAFETSALMIYHVSLFLHLFTRRNIWFAISIIVLFILIVYQRIIFTKKQIAFDVCPHIKKIHSI